MKVMSHIYIRGLKINNLKQALTTLMWMFVHQFTRDPAGRNFSIV